MQEPPFLEQTFPFSFGTGFDGTLTVTFLEPFTFLGDTDVYLRWCDFRMGISWGHFHGWFSSLQERTPVLWFCEDAEKLLAAPPENRTRYTRCFGDGDTHTFALRLAKTGTKWRLHFRHRSDSRGDLAYTPDWVLVPGQKKNRLRSPLRVILAGADITEKTVADLIAFLRTVLSRPVLEDNRQSRGVPPPRLPEDPPAGTEPS